MKELIDQLKKAVSIDSTAFVGVAEICAFYAELCDQYGIPYQFVREGEAILVNPLKSSELLIYNLLETKEPGPHSYWEEAGSNPFDTTFSGDKIIGLGVANSKLSMLFQIEAFRRIKESKGKLPAITFFGGSYGKMELDTEEEELAPYLQEGKEVLVMRPTSGRFMSGICAKAKIRFHLPLTEQESELKHRHFHVEDTATQTRIFRGITTHGASPNKKLENNAFRKLIEYLEYLPQGVLVLSMEAGHSSDQVPAEAVLELNLSQPVNESVSNKLLALVKRIDEVEQKFKNRREKRSAELPRLNIGKLRHKEKSLQLDMSFYLPIDIPKKRLYQELERFRSELKEFKLDYEVREFMEGVSFEEPKKLKENLLASAGECGFKPQWGESVMESAARLIHKKKCKIIKYGNPIGLGNIDEPNEKISRLDMENSIKMLEKLSLRYL